MTLIEAVTHGRAVAKDSRFYWTVNRYRNGYSVSPLIADNSDRGHRPRFIISPSGDLMNFSNLRPALQRRAA
jgi:hypothetical protein